MVDASLAKILKDIKVAVENTKKELKEEIGASRRELLREITTLKESITVIEKKCCNLEDRIENLEKRARKNNIVIYGLPDQGDQKGIALADWLVVEIKSLLGIEFCISDINDVYYLGKKIKRPLFVEIRSFLKKDLILKNAYKLKGKSIYINNDQSKKERVVSRVLNQHLKEAKKKGLKAYIKKSSLFVNNEVFTYDQLIEETKQDSDDEVFTEVLPRTSMSAPGTPNVWNAEIEIEKGTPADNTQGCSDNPAIPPTADRRPATRSSSFKSSSVSKK